MSIDAELETWRRQWQTGTAVPLDLRRRVERQSRFMRIAFLGDVLVTVVIGGFTTAWAIRSPQPDIVLLAAVTWLFLAVAWTFALAINRGKWSPSAVDTATFIDLSVRRCRSRLTVVWVWAGLSFCEVVFGLTWVYHHASEHRRPLLSWLSFSSLPMDFVWLFTLALGIALVWYRRRKRTELVYLLGLQEQDRLSQPPDVSDLRTTY